MRAYHCWVQSGTSWAAVRRRGEAPRAAGGWWAGAVFFVALALAASGQACAPCSPCLTQGIWTFSCIGRSLTSVPEIPSFVKTVDLSSNNIAEINATAFRSLANVTIIELKFNLLTRLADFAFADLTLLTVIKLSYNNLVAIGPRAFFNLPALAQLHLGGNNIVNMSGAAESLLPSLQYLALGSNSLTEFPLAFLGRTPSLEILSLEENAISSIPPQGLAVLPQLRYLNMSANQVGKLTIGLFSSAFAQAAQTGWNTWYYLHHDLPIELEALTTGIELVDNPLTFIGRSLFASLPANTLVTLTKPAFPMQLSSCCGLEWLANSPNILYAPSSLFCRLPNGTSLAVEYLPQHVICPCVTPHLPGPIPTPSLDECKNASNWRLFESQCQYLTECPPGYRVVPTDGQASGAFLSCAGFTGGLVLETILLETACQPCGVEHCLSCPASDGLCARCSPGTFLFEALCVTSCPDGFSANLVTGMCEACISQTCLACPGHRANCTVCRFGTLLYQGQCLTTCIDSPVATLGNATATSGLVGGACEVCSSPHCSVCRQQASVCTSCTAPFLVLRGDCVSSCPSDDSITLGVCVSPVLTRTQKIVIVVMVSATVVALAVLALCYRRRIVRAFGRVESSLRLRLLDAQEEVEALHRVWEIAPGELTVHNVLGRGSYGTVYAGRWNDTPVAVKQLNPAFALMGAEVLDDFGKELMLLRTLRHKAVVTLFGAGSFADGKLFLVMELLERGCLTSVLASGPLPLSRRVAFARDAAAGMAYLHGMQRLHRDLKSGNLLVSSLYVVKVADFGSSRLLDIASQSTTISTTRAGKRTSSMRAGPSTEMSLALTDHVGTPLWMSPEVLEGSSFFFTSDVYSFGIVMWEIASQQLPWQSVQPPLVSLLKTFVCRGDRPPLPTAMPPAYNDLMQQCWAPAPTSRPPFRAVLAALDALLATLGESSEGRDGNI